jgi:hypothetical protein
VLQHKSSTPADYYQASITLAESYEFVFTRPDEDPYASVITTMPPEVSISAPDGETIAQDQDFDILWDSDGSGEIHLLIDGDCIWDYPDVLGDDIPDNGSHTVSAGGIDPQDEDDPDTCVAEIELTRETTGTLDTSLKGTIEGKSRDRTSFTTTAPTP